MISMIQGLPVPINEYNAIVPGSRIPEWFNHQNVGCSVNIELSSDWYNTKLMGLAFCVVLNFEAIHSYKFGMMIAKSSHFGLVCYLNAGPVLIFLRPGAK